METLKVPASTSNGAGAPVEPEIVPETDIQRNDSIPVCKRKDGLGESHSRHLCDFLNVALLRSLHFSAEYLKIEDIRSELTARESPFVAGNNAGGGFGKLTYYLGFISYLG